jgi:hypothetical protein
VRGVVEAETPVCRIGDRVPVPVLFFVGAAALWMVNERVVFFILCLVLSVLLLLLPGKLLTAQIEKTKDYARYFAGYDASAEE